MLHSAGPGAPYPDGLHRRRLTRQILLLGSLLLTGCATTPVAPTITPYAPDAPVQLSGRFSFQRTSNLPQSRPQHSSGRFTLSRTAHDLNLDLSSPFGQTLVRAAQHQHETAWLETAQHQRYTGPTLEAVLQDAIGIPVPVSHLPNWLANRFEHIDEQTADSSHLRAHDAGWQIERNGNHWFLTWQQNQEQLDIRLVIDPASPAP